MKDEEALRTGLEPETTDGEETVGKDPAPGRQTGAEEPTAPMSMPPTPSDPSAAPKPSAKPRPAPSPEHVARVYSVQIQEIIAQRLVRAGLNDADREELTQIICEGLLFMSDPPTDQESCAKATNDIAGKKIAGFRRQGFRRAKVDAGLTDEADNHASQDAREHANGHHAQRIAVVQEALTDGTLTDRDAQMLALKREGLTDAQIAEKLGMAQQTVSNRIAMARKKMRQKWQQRVATLTALTLAVAILIVVGWRKREEVARFFHLEAPAPAPAPAPTRPVPEPSIPVALQQAEKLRSEAIEACNSGQFATCSDRLEAAAKLDPAGDTDPLMVRMRHDIEDHIRPEKHQVGAKPGGL
ncbi:MAG TPA: sigma-70 family RNA polymerase sigma factor [Polyangiaceae bacterium]|nr:sigma-70 family RNA polymerase sigma factor [Polyangiaceae bacterium]